MATCETAAMIGATIAVIATMTDLTAVDAGRPLLRRRERD